MTTVLTTMQQRDDTFWDRAAIGGFSNFSNNHDRRSPLDNAGLATLPIHTLALSVTIHTSDPNFILFCFVCISFMADRPQRARLPIPPTYCNVAILPVVTIIKDFPISPRFSPYDFLSRCKFSTLTTRQIVTIIMLSFRRGWKQQELTRTSIIILLSR